MISTILIDDERPALRELEYLLCGAGNIDVTGMYSDPRKGIEAVAELKPQVVFLDISMPQLSGIDAASMILDRYPETHIVFVTAYDQYAVEAFELYALDYILKPVTKERLEKTLKRLREKTERGNSREKRLQIQCLGRFQIGWDDGEPIKWRSEKTEELFAFLLHNRGKIVSRDEIIEAVWPDAAPERAAHQLHSAVYYIRKTLESYGIPREQVRINSGYRLDLGDTEVDVARFRKLCEKLKEGGEISGLGMLPYAGQYFDGSGWIWAAAERERLSRDFVLAALFLSKALIKSSDFEAAEKLLINAFEKNPYEEAVTSQLLELYGRTGSKSNAAKHYREYSRILKSDLGIEPSEEITKIHKEIQKNNF
ncbi:MAG: response regulator [Clostridiaceae bacterium]|nr:response regulator [Clostridiaceae bacterium]